MPGLSALFALVALALLLAPTSEAFIAPALAPRVASGRLCTGIRPSEPKCAPAKLRLGRPLRVGLTGGVGESLLDWERERDDEVPPSIPCNGL